MDLVLTPSSPPELYSHHLSNACWSGARIVLAQTTADSETIFDLIIATFASSKDPKTMADLAAHHQRSQVSKEAFDGVLSYSAQVSSDYSIVR